MLSNYELKDAEFLIILLAVLCNWCLTFLKKKNMCLITKLITLLKARIEAKNNTSCIRIQSITMRKTIYGI